MMTQSDLEEHLGERHKIIYSSEKETITECCFCGAEYPNGLKKSITQCDVTTDEIRGNYLKTNERYTIWGCTLGNDNCPFLQKYVELIDHLDMPHPIRHC